MKGVRNEILKVKMSKTKKPSRKVVFKMCVVVTNIVGENKHIARRAE